ncbi:MAG: hypothetical protein AAF223_14670, partial [Bacteroidota bacterium]
VKPDCNKPKESCSIKNKQACSPGNTKTSEASVLTELRKELVAVKSSLGFSQEVEVGKTDDESLQIMLTVVNALLKEEGMAEVSSFQSKAQTVSEIRNKIAELKKRG